MIRALFFGTYESDRHPRVRVLAQGFRQLGDEVGECNVPLDLSTESRIELLRKPWRIARFACRLGRAWWRLARAAKTWPRPDVVVVGYLGHLDVHLARFLWPGIPIVLDYLVSLADTARDRRVGGGEIRWALERMDAAALRAADVVAVDTEEHRRLLESSVRDRSIVVPVGAAEEWFEASSPPSETDHIRVVFFGLYTPLQGTPVIGEAIARLAGEPVDFLMVGTGQEYEKTRRRAAANPSVRWQDWIDPAQLPTVVARHHVCLGIFGTDPKAQRVVPNKVYQGAACGCAVVTSDTPPQRRALGDAGVFVSPGDPEALATAIRALARDPDQLERLKTSAARRARDAFRPPRVARALKARLRVSGEIE